MAGLGFKIGANTAGLLRGLKSARGALGKTMKVAGKTGIALGMTAGVAGLVGMKKALDLGSELSDVAANTGLLAGEAMVLGQAFKDAGIGADKVQGTINKMQKSIVEAGDGLETYRRAFSGIGIEMDDLAGKKPGEQFSMIQKALSEVADPAERSARAMQIFGRAGGELGALISNGDALANAKNTLGSQADILSQNADAFDRSADILGSMGSKITGFFVGLADYINPVLMPVLEGINGIDLAAYGQAVGRFVAIIAKAFGSGALPGMMKDGLVLAGKVMLNGLFKGFLGLGAMMVTGLSHVPEIVMSGFRMLTDSSFWAGLGILAVGLGVKLGAAVMSLLAPIIEFVGGTDISDKMSEDANTMMEAGAKKISESQAKEFGKALVRAMDDSAAAFNGAMADSDNILNEDKERDNLRKTWKGLSDSVAEERKLQKEKLEALKAEAALEAKKAAEAGNNDKGSPEAKTGILEGVQKNIVSSMARIGGAALGGVQTNLDQKRNKLLENIERNTRGGSTARYA